MTKIESMKQELEALQTDIEALSEIWEQCWLDENCDVVVPEELATKIAIILGF